MDNILKLIIIGASVILTCLVVGLAFRIGGESKSISVSSSEKLTEFSKELSESDLMAYDGLEINGDDVINAIKKYLGEYGTGEVGPIRIRVKTSINTYTYENGVYLSDIRNFTTSRYIKPISKFKGKVERDTNKVITLLEFQQM